MGGLKEQGELPDKDCRVVESGGEGLAGRGAMRWGTDLVHLNVCV